MTLPAGDMDFTMIRLVNGSGPHQGRVEVFHDRRWGTVCDDGWDKKDGDVVCRMLGFHGVEEVYRTARFGQGKNGEVRYQSDNMAWPSSPKPVSPSCDTTHTGRLCSGDTDPSLLFSVHTSYLQTFPLYRT